MAVIFQVPSLTDDTMISMRACVCVCVFLFNLGLGVRNLHDV